MSEAPKFRCTAAPCKTPDNTRLAVAFLLKRPVPAVVFSPCRGGCPFEVLVEQPGSQEGQPVDPKERTFCQT